jgi:hypothetical protein
MTVEWALSEDVPNAGVGHRHYCSARHIDRILDFMLLSCANHLTGGPPLIQDRLIP